MSDSEQPCPVCGRAMVLLGETNGEVALMCGYCTYNCTVLTSTGTALPTSGEEQPDA